MNEFERLGAAVVGVSRDTPKSHAGFIAKHGLGITLLSDPELASAEAFGVRRVKEEDGKLKTSVVRSTFLVDPWGIVRRAWSQVSVAGHAEAVLRALGEELG